MSTRADELFNKCEKEGWTFIQWLMEEKHSEEFSIEYKRSENNGSTSSLASSDRNNLSKAVSGFSNSEGGIIVWGVRCKSGSGGDLPDQFSFIEQPHRFASAIETAVGGVTVPPHTGVRSLPILNPKKSNEGVVVTLVPKSDLAPHQAIPELKYYMRGGGNFVPVPHAVLSGMFGKRPQPRIVSNFEMYPLRKQGKKTLCILCNVVLRNEGRGIARDVYVNLDFISSVGQRCKIGFSPIDENYWIFTKTRAGDRFSAIGGDSIKVPPKGDAVPCRLSLEITPPIEFDLDLRGSCGAEGAEPHIVNLFMKRKDVELMHEDLTASTQHDLTLNEAAQRKFIDIYYRKMLNSRRS